MKDSLILEDKIYISAKRVQELFGYTSDYVGQLCRLGKLECKMIGRSWFVTEKSIIDHRSNVNEILKSKIKEKRKSSQKLYRTFNAPVYNAIETIVEQKPKQNPSILLIAPPHPIVPVPEIFTLPYFVCDKFTTSYFPEIDKKAKLSEAKLVVSTAVLFVSLFLVTSSVSVSKKIVTTLSDNINSASIISASQVVWEDMVQFVSNQVSKIATNNPKVDFNGIAVAPSSNSIEEDEVIKEKIRASFSDEVVVKPDNSKTAGVITPVFRKAKGDDFVYVLVPVNDKN